MLSQDDVEQKLSECITLMVNSMTLWNDHMLSLFHERYQAKFCTQCGMKRTYYRDILEPCSCDDRDL